MIEDSLEILKSLYPNKEYVLKSKSSYSMYVSGKENFIIGVDIEEDKIYFMPYKLNHQPQQNKILVS